MILAEKCHSGTLSQLHFRDSLGDKYLVYYNYFFSTMNGIIDDVINLLHFFDNVGCVWLCGTGNVIENVESTIIGTSKSFSFHLSEINASVNSSC